MPNPIHNNMHGANRKGGQGPSPQASGSSPKLSMPEKTANWGGLPGKTGPNRSGGVKKLKVYPKSEGI